MLSYPGVDIAFQYTDEIGRKIRKKRCNYKENQKFKIFCKQTFIDNLTG